MSAPGEPIHGEIHSADASAGVAITLYKQGSLTAYTLQAYEYIEIESLELVTVPGGDCAIFIGADATPGAGEYIVRGTFAANGGIAMSSMRYTGRINQLAYVIAPIGVVDVTFKGTVRLESSTSPRGRWRESLVPGA